MPLTREETFERKDPTRFPTAQLFYLALVRVSEPIAILSIFPYAWRLVLDFNFGDSSNASFYAGILVSAFSLAECLTSMLWGGLSDRIGRKPVLLLGCCGTILSLLIVGFSTSFWMALLGRILGGLLNGNQGVIQTMVGELVTLPKHEPKAFAVMPFVWSVGAMIGPAIGGCFARPVENFPFIFHADGLFGRFPYLLPNLICAVLLLVAVILGTFCIDETHPDMQPWSTKEDLDHTTARTPLMTNSGATNNAAADLREASYGTFNAVDIQQRCSSPSKTSSKVFTRRVLMIVLALSIFTYHSMTYDHLLPIFLQDRRFSEDISITSIPENFAGGLGLSTQRVGVIMFFNGFIALVVQGVIFPLAASWLGIWKIFILCTLGHPFAYFIVPYLTILPPNLLLPGIYTALTIRNLFAILAWPIMLILLKEASPNPASLGKINGLAAAAGASCRTLASPLAGYLYGVSIKLGFTPLAWWVSCGIAVVGAMQLAFVRRQKDEKARVRLSISFVRPEH